MTAPPHQEHILPWSTLANHFTFVYANKEYDDPTNLYPMFKPNQGEQLQEFARIFAKIIEESSGQERKRYPEKMVPPVDDEVLISERTAERIAETIVSCKDTHVPRRDPPISARSDAMVLTTEERKVSFWTWSDETRERNWLAYKNREIRCAEIVNILALHREMAPLLRIASRRDSQFDNILACWSGSKDCTEDWSFILNLALKAYLCLAKPDLCDQKQRTQRLQEMTLKYKLPYTDQIYDYCNTSSYQGMLISCTYTPWRDGRGVTFYPHRDFFGIRLGMITTPITSPLAQDRIGRVPCSEIFDSSYRSWFLPSAADVSSTLNTLTRRLPAEIALMILEFADEKPYRRTSIPNDPLHPSNAAELEKYLSECWMIMVRVNMLTKMVGTMLEWEFMVMEAIQSLWGVKDLFEAKFVRSRE